MSQSQQGLALVSVDTRALVDKVLARYSGEFTVFRELLQNSDDAGCDTVEIRFETAAFLGLDPEPGTNAAPPRPPNPKTTNVVQWTFKNHGKPFTPEDWDRLPKIAWGNPDPQKVGAFGVGFYSVFSVTETPYVSSGDKQMEFSWNKDQLSYQLGDLPQAVTRDLWTTFKMPLREAAPMPAASEFMRFLASSITFMVHLKDVTIFFDHDRVGQIKKSLGQSQAVPILAELEQRSPEKNMIPSRLWLSRSHNVVPRESTRQMDLTVFTAEVDITANKKLSEELKRCTKKYPPSRIKYSLIYTESDKYDQSLKNQQKHPRELPSVFRNLDGSTHTGTRIFIGHATSQTTGIGGHMASHFIPTVERESIDLVDKNVAIWNSELLYVGGFLCRVVYELELSKMQSSWEREETACPSRRLQDSFLHVLKFFTFHESTPSSKVAQLLANSFYGCSSLPLRLLSSSGVHGVPDVRAFDPVVAKFLRSSAMLSEHVMREGAYSITALPDQYKISAITPSEVLQELRHRTLGVRELVACLRWWMTSRENNATGLLDVATFSGTSGTTHLSSITYFIDPNVLGRHIPPDGPFPLSLIPLGVSKYFCREELLSLGWEEFTVDSWLQHISHPDVMSADEEYDITRSDYWASRVLCTLCLVWPQLPEDVRSESRKVLGNRPCIPTSKGLCSPGSSYLPITDDSLFHHLDLPIISRDWEIEVDRDMRRLLVYIGVRETLPVQFLLHQMLSTGYWTVFKLVEYLVQVEPFLTSEDFSALKMSKLFVSESNGKEGTRRCADELYPPLDIFRKLGLPVIGWSGTSGGWNASPEAQLLYRLGLNHIPSLAKIVELCSSRDTEVQETAFMYLCQHLHSQYPDYNAENFGDVEFIPAETKDRTCLKKLGEVYSCAQWKALGFSVVPRGLSAPWDQLGVTQHPQTTKLLEMLEKTPPPDEETARRWFEVLSDHVRSFSPHDLIKLSGLRIVPTGPSGTLKLLPPTKCYLDQAIKSPLYGKLFPFVNFGPKANRFLGDCGCKNKVSIEDVVEVLIENPGRFFELAGGYENFLVELRKVAYQSREISNHTLNKLSHTPTLLGVRRKKTEDQAGWDYEHQFLTYQEVTIVDDTVDYQLFSDYLFVAPQEEVLERFYASLGCSYLSALVEERCNDLHEIPDAETCLEVQSLILERLPLFIRKYSDTKPRVTIPSSPDHLEVKACRRIRVSRTLVIGNVERTRDVWAIAKRKGDCIELWISKTSERDTYEVATSLCRLFFGANKMNPSLLLDTILSSDLDVLERRGFIVDQTPQQHGDGYRGRKKHLGRSASIINSAQRSTPDTQPDPQLNHERMLGSSGTTPQFPSLPHAADILAKICEATNVSGDKSLDTVVEQTIALPLSWTSREVIPQNYIRDTVEKAINACGLGREKSAIQTGVSQLLSSGFCRVSADIRNLHHIETMKDIQVWVDKGAPNTDAFMEHMHDPLSRFVDVIIPLSELYHISTTTLRIFYDVSGGCIAFNCGGIIYLNLRYFEVWHDEQVKSGTLQNAQISWFLALAHEIAHNLTDLHDSDHEFWFSAICEAHLAAFMQLLRPTNTWLRSILWLRGMVFVILLAYLTKRIALVINISR